MSFTDYGDAFPWGEKTTTTTHIIQLSAKSCTLRLKSIESQRPAMSAEHGLHFDVLDGILSHAQIHPHNSGEYIRWPRVVVKEHPYNWIDCQSTLNYSVQELICSKHSWLIVHIQPVNSSDSHCSSFLMKLLMFLSRFAKHPAAYCLNFSH